nr:hypothetical protein [Tanacetum cinerariifolium]
MLNKENYVPWSSRLLRYAKTRPNGKLIHNSIINGPYVRRMIPEPGDTNREVTIEADDQAIQTILLGLLEDIYAAVDREEGQVIQRIGKNQIGNGNLVVARAEGNAAGQNGNQIRCYNCRGKEEVGIQLQAEEYDLMAAVADLDEIKEYTELRKPIPESHQVPQNDNDIIYEVTSVEQGEEIVEQHSVNFEETRALYDSLYHNLAIEVEKVNSVNRNLKETNADLTLSLQDIKIKQAKFVGDFKSLANEVDASFAKHKALELEIERLMKAVVSQDIMNIVQKESVVDTSDLQTELEHQTVASSVGRSKGKRKDTSCVSDTRNPLSQKLENKNLELEFQLFKKVSDQKDNTHDTSANTNFAKQPIVENLPKVGESHALSKPVTSNSVSTPQESIGVNNDKVISLGMFRINPFKTFKKEKHVPNTVSASARTKPITISQPPVFTKKDGNSDLNGLSSTGDVISKVVYAMCKQCLISVNHNVCLRNYVNGKNSRGYPDLFVVRRLRDSYEVPANSATTGSASDETGKKKGRTVTLTTDDMQKRKNDVKARTTLLLSLPNEHQL